MQPTYSITRSGMATSQDFYPIELYYTVEAAGTTWGLVPSQLTAQSQQFTVIGNGTVDMSLANAQNLAAPLNGSPISSDANASNLAAGLVAYFTNIPAAADGVYCVAFAVSGLQLSGTIGATLTIINKASAAAANPARILANFNSVTVIPSPITLGTTGKLLTDVNNPASEIVYGTNTLVVVPSAGVIFGAFAVTDVTDVPVANDIALLTVLPTP